MRKFFIVVFLFITGCSVVEEVEINSEQPQVQSADFRKQHNRKQLMSPTNNYNSTIFLEDGILFEVGRADSDTQGGGINSSLLMFQAFDANIPIIINADPSTLCTFDNYQKCSGHIDAFDNVHYYNNALYTIGSEINYEDDQSQYQVHQTDLLLNNKKLVYTMDMVTNKELGNQVPSFVFHNDQMIITSEYGVHIVDMETWNKTVLFEQSQAYIDAGDIWDDKLYLTVLNYLNNEGKMQKSAFIEVDLKSKEVKEVYQEIPAATNNGAFILRNDDNIVYYEEDHQLKSFEIKTQEEFDMGKFGFMYWNEVFSSDLFVLFDNSEENRFVLMDFKGNELSSIPREEGETWGEYLDDEGYFYRAISKPNSYKLMRHKIENQKFGKAEVVIEVGEQEK